MTEGSSKEDNEMVASLTAKTDNENDEKNDDLEQKNDEEKASDDEIKLSNDEEENENAKNKENSQVLMDGASSAPLSETDQITCAQSQHEIEDPSVHINTKEVMSKVNTKSACCILI